MLENEIGRKSEEELKVFRVTVQVSAKEKEKIYKVAKKFGMTVSDLVRIKCIYEPYKTFWGEEE